MVLFSRLGKLGEEPRTQNIGSEISKGVGGAKRDFDLAETICKNITWTCQEQVKSAALCAVFHNISGKMITI